MKTRSRESARLGLWVFATVHTSGNLLRGAVTAAYAKAVLDAKSGKFVDDHALSSASMTHVVKLFSAFRVTEHGNIRMLETTT